MRVHVIFALFLLMGGGTVFAQTPAEKPAEKSEAPKKYLYQWTDDRGGVHITDELGKVPPGFRDRAMQLEAPKQEQKTGEPQGRQAPVPAYSDTRQTDEAKKAEWRWRMQDARQRLADAERRYQELEQRRQDVLGKWGGPASGHREGRIEAESIEQEMKQVQREIDDARNRIEVVLPEEARKAGIPPGWLRE